LKVESSKLKVTGYRWQVYFFGEKECLLASMWKSDG
jgi:hypothetical protein